MANDEIGSQVAGRFVIQEKIGEGGMGSVYRAIQTSLDREVALKLLHAHNAFTSRARRRFAREARAIARLNHPHIAGVYDFGVDEHNESLWLAMEFIDGKSMTPMKREPIDIVRLLSLTDQILSALAAAHARGIIHRDLKPSNVLLTTNDEGIEVIKLVDFGLAATYQDELDLTNAPVDLGEEEEGADRVILGTPRYMAPEIFRRLPVDPRVDLYALGVMLYEILAGQPPYPGDDPRVVMKGHLKQPIPQLIARDQFPLPAEMEGGIYKLLAKDPNERFQNANDTRELFSAVIAQYSYAPWVVMGPGADAGNFRLADLSMAGVSMMGSRTVVPALSTEMSTSRFGPASAPVAPLVGRETERQSLEARLRRALQHNQGSLIFLEGEFGVGKSRLMDWVRVRVEEMGLMRCAQGSYAASTRGFHGLRTILEQLLQINDFPFGDRQDSIYRRLQQWSFSQDEIDVFVRLLLPEASNMRLVDVSPDGADATDQERAFAVVERVLRRLASEKPLLLIIENVHDADESSLAFLEHLAIGLHLSPAPLVVLASFRSEELEHNERLHQTLDRLIRFDSEDIMRIKLDRLSAEDARRLVLKLAPVDDMLAERIASRSEGNPLLVTQIFRYLQEGKKLVYDSGQWRLTPESQLESEIPIEVADMMRYRVGQVCRRATDPEAMRAILDRCAVLGQQFSYGLLTTMLALEGEHPWSGAVDEMLESLVRRGVLREVGHSGEDVLAFDHNIMRDVLLQDIKARRSQRALHSLAAQAKLKRWKGNTGDRALEIVEHFKQAKDTAGVYRYTLRAAQSSLNTGDLKGAMALFRQADELLSRISVTDAEQLTEGMGMNALEQSERIALEVAHLSRRLGEYEASRQAYRKLLTSNNMLIGLWSRWGLGCLAQRQGDFDEAVGWYEATRRETLRARQFKRDDVEENQALLVDAYCLFGLGHVKAERGDLEAAALALGEALERAQKNKETSLELQVLLVQMDVVWHRGEVDRAEVCRRRALMLADGFGDAELMALTHLAVAQLLCKMGRVRDALSRVEIAQESFEALGKRHSVAHCLLLRGQLYRLQRADKDAAKTFRQAHRFYDVFNDRRGLTECKYLLARLALGIRRYPDAQSLIRDALEGYRQMGDRTGEMWCRLMIGRLELALQKHDKATYTFDEVAGVFEGLGDKQALSVVLWLRALSLELSGAVGAREMIDAGLERWEVGHLIDGSLIFALEQLVELLRETRPVQAIEIDTMLETIRQVLGIWTDE